MSKSASAPSIARSRGRIRSGLRSSSGSASQPSWKSMRHTSSACRCSSADWFGMERRIEPEPPLGRKVRLHVDVGDEEAVAEDLALGFEAQQRAHRAARAVGDDRASRRRASSRRPASRRAARRRRRAGVTLDDLVLPADLGGGSSASALDQELLEVILLQVDERRPAMAGLRQQVELDRRARPEEDLADVPARRPCATTGSPQPSRSRISSVRFA